MSKIKNHSKLPFAAQKTTIYTLDGLEWVATTNRAIRPVEDENTELDEGNAAFLAHAGNHHDKLVSGLKEVLRRLDVLHDQLRSDRRGDYGKDPELQRIRVDLVEAEGE